MNTDIGNYATMDGNEACAYVAYAFTEISAIYPIAPSSPMAQQMDVWASQGRKNLLGQTVTLVEMESEAGVAAALHGAAETGALATTFTSSQGLLLMIPVMHRIVGERLPCVIHVASRAVGTHAISIRGDHSDVMNCRQTGFAMLCSANPQEVMDLAPVAHLAALSGRIPFLHFFDGFQTSHELGKIRVIPYDVFQKLFDREKLAGFRQQALNPEHPKVRSTIQGSEAFFQLREANNRFYDALPGIVQGYMDQLGAVTGRNYHLFDYFGPPDAARVIVAMGVVSGIVRETVDFLNSHGEKNGFVQVHLFRPFAVEAFLAALPETTERIAVLDRCKEMGSAGEPLFQDVCTAVVRGGRKCLVVGGRFGISGKNVNPPQIIAVFEHLKQEHPHSGFTIGIEDDVTNLSLPYELAYYPDDKYQLCCKFWGLGSDGTISSVRNAVKIIHSCTSKFAQANYEHDAKKSFGVTTSYLRISDKPFRTAGSVQYADFIGCHHETFIRRFDLAAELKLNAVLLLNTGKTGAELEAGLPCRVKRLLARRNAGLFTIDATALAEKFGLGSHTNLILQTAFFHLMKILPDDLIRAQMKEYARNTYAASEPEVIHNNCLAVDAAIESLVEITVPAAWKELRDDVREEDPDRPAFVRTIADPINLQKGDTLPVSVFAGYEDGTVEMGLTAWEKRGIGIRVPVWNAAHCLQCNRCAMFCPQAAIRPVLLNAEEKAAAPADFPTLPAGEEKGLHFSLVLSKADCNGCGVCANSCPSAPKALQMRPAGEVGDSREFWDYARKLLPKKGLFEPWNVRGSQFLFPFFEFSGACSGCPEAAYVKLLTQLFGDRVYWANSAGCSHAWGGPLPGVPFTIDANGRGPAYSNSLFENNAEFSYGMFLSVKQQRGAEKERLLRLAGAAGLPAEIREAIAGMLASFEDFDASREAAGKLIGVLEKVPETMPYSGEVREILRHRDMLARKTFWMFGGDGWAYDIGFGGLDHVLASGDNLNVFIADTEIYSNTGGQFSKATPIGAVTQFAGAGKNKPKKDLGRMLMTYGNIYVAQVAMGADPEQLLLALREAESYDGPSVIIAYSPCLSHGIKGGMEFCQQEMKRAVETGHWLLYRYDPRREKPLVIDSGAPQSSYQDFLDGESRYTILARTFPENAADYFDAACKFAAKRYELYKKMEERQ